MKIIFWFGVVVVSQCRCVAPLLNSLLIFICFSSVAVSLWLRIFRPGSTVCARIYRQFKRKKPWRLLQPRPPIILYLSPILSAVESQNEHTHSHELRFFFFFFARLVSFVFFALARSMLLHPNHHQSHLGIRHWRWLAVVYKCTIRCVIITIISHRCLTVPLNTYIGQCAASAYCVCDDDPTTWYAPACSNLFNLRWVNCSPLRTHGWFQQRFVVACLLLLLLLRSVRCCKTGEWRYERQ